MKRSQRRWGRKEIQSELFQLFGGLVHSVEELESGLAIEASIDSELLVMDRFTESILIPQVSHSLYSWYPSCSPIGPLSSLDTSVNHTRVETQESQFNKY